MRVEVTAKHMVGVSSESFETFPLNIKILIIMASRTYLHGQQFIPTAQASLQIRYLLLLLPRFCMSCHLKQTPGTSNPETKPHQIYPADRSCDMTKARNTRLSLAPWYPLLPELHITLCDRLTVNAVSAQQRKKANLENGSFLFQTSNMHSK